MLVGGEEVVRGEGVERVDAGGGVAPALRLTSGGAGHLALSTAL